MKLREQKKNKAAKILSLIEEKSLIDAVGGVEGYYLTQMRKMAEGADIKYDGDMNWVKIDFLSQYPDINQELNDLAAIEGKLMWFSWIPWA